MYIYGKDQTINNHKKIYILNSFTSSTGNNPIAAKSIKNMYKDILQYQKNSLGQILASVKGEKIPALNSYACYIKSHCEAPDFEQEVEAYTKEEAVDKIMGIVGDYGWDRETIDRYTVEL